MTFIEFKKQSEKLGYSLKDVTENLGLLDEQGTGVYDKHKLVAFIPEDRSDSYSMMECPCPKYKECDLISDYSNTELADRQREDVPTCL